jgi:predicted kinase
MTTTAPARLVLICGLPGSGKTTLARELERSMPAVRFGADEWMVALGVDLWEQPFRSLMEARLRALTADLLRLGIVVVLEFGFWSRAERDALRAMARGLGVPVELRFLDVPMEELWRRVDARNRTDAWPDRPITRFEMDYWSGQFEPPTPEELATYDPPA